MLPNFLIIGAAKAGTTSLYHYLDRHPEIFVAHPKELKFFVEELNWSRGVEWYERHFSGAEREIALGEASTHYTAYPELRGVPQRIAELIPEVRLIYIVRQPIDRMISYYWMRVRQGKERQRSVEKAILTDPRYVDGSRYSMQIEQYLEHFSLERMKIIVSDDLLHARARTLTGVCRFLGVDPDKMPLNTVEYNTTRSQRPQAVRPAVRRALLAVRRIPGGRPIRATVPMTLKRKIGRSVKHPLVTIGMDRVTSISEDARQELENRLRPDIVRLRDYLGPDFDAWGLA